MLSILMPAKNASKYIEDAINGLSELSNCELFELIVVEDHSTDNTLEILLEMESRLSFMQVYVNPGKGKIDALNYGYTQAKGDFIKTIDADDVFLPTTECMNIFVNDQYDVVVHGAVIVDEFLNKIGSYEVNKKYIQGNKNGVINGLVSLPRWSFSFSKKVSDTIFPIPEEMEYEDVWMSALVKLKKFKIHHYKNPQIYLYRQHDNQAFGGVMSSETKVIRKRAQTMLSMIDYIEKSSNIDWKCFDFTAIKRYYMYLISNSFFDVVFDGDLRNSDKVKCLLYSYFSFLIPIALRMKWFFDAKGFFK